MGCMCVGNVDNDPAGTQKIVTGSLQGVLRVFSPRQGDYKVEHQLLEVQLEQPVLQLLAGHFTVNHSGLTLAVLHPQKVSVYSVAASGSATHHEIKKLYDHHLEHSSANMCHGTFGNTQGIDGLCVQSLDGQLSFFESESLAFSRFLPNFLLPGPLAYVPETDSFITANSGLTIESYKFKGLAASSEEKPSEAQGKPGLSAGKRLQADWTLIVGENVLDMKVVHMSKGPASGQADVLVLGEHNFYLLSDHGHLLMQKRLDYPPAAIAVFGAGTQDNMMVASSTANLLVYKESHMAWCASCDEVPVALHVGEFGGLKGLVASLSDDGVLAVYYMGTSPPLNIVGASEGKELDYVAMDEEHRQLLATIRSATSNVRTEPTERLQLRAQVPTVLDQSSRDMNPCVTARVFVSYIGSGAASDIFIAASAPPPLQVQISHSVVSSVSSGSRTPVIVPVTISLQGNTLPAGNVVTVTATYLKDGNNPRVATCKFEVPMVLLCTAIPPVKNATYKITLDTNRLPPALPALFDDVLAMSPAGAEAAQASGGNALTFQCHSGECITILVSKNAGRYRLQSDHFEAIWVLADELVRRLTSYYQGPGSDAGGGHGPFAVSFTENLPLQDYWAVIDAHFQARGRVLLTRQELSRRAQEMRSVQKRLLMRFKDKNPAPLGNMDTLLEDTYSKISGLSNQWEQEQAALDVASAALAGATQLMILLISCTFGMDTEATEVLRSHLSPVVHDTAVMNSKDELEYHGWEEVTETAMTQLLKSCLARSAKESAAQVPPVAQLPDTVKLKKHISLVLERLSKGGHLSAA